MGPPEGTSSALTWTLVLYKGTQGTTQAHECPVPGACLEETPVLVDGMLGSRASKVVPQWSPHLPLAPTAPQPLVDPKHLSMLQVFHL